mmetsp:Transcript_26018/g.68304  ORF Transcript_26018/g.68304 Transcript_26018/m.68304 type:complete len:227 (-) Transcript_26018:573-1253(-)
MLRIRRSHLQLNFPEDPKSLAHLGLECTCCMSGKKLLRLKVLRSVRIPHSLRELNSPLCFPKSFGALPVRFDTRCIHAQFNCNAIGIYPVNREAPPMTHLHQGLDAIRFHTRGHASNLFVSCTKRCMRTPFRLSQRRVKISMPNRTLAHIFKSEEGDEGTPSNIKEGALHPTFLPPLRFATNHRETEKVLVKMPRGLQIFCCKRQVVKAFGGKKLWITRFSQGRLR